MLIHPWIEDYITTALRIDRYLSRTDQPNPPFVDHYYGPPHLKAVVETEPIQSQSVLQAAVDALQQRLPVQDFSEQRRSFLGKHLRAMDSMCRMMSGQRWVFLEEIENCLDIQPEFVDHDQFEYALKLLDTALPGSGDIQSRYRQIQEKTIIPAGQSARITSLVYRILNEVRSRTSHRWTLPDGEALALDFPSEMYGGAANWYLGTYRSRLEINTDRPVNLFGLIYQMCHEAYPGHHTEFVMKEKHLYREQGYTEQSIFILGPQLVIAEGIASEAIQMIFTPEDLAQWITEVILPEFNIAVPDIDLAAFSQFSMLSLLDAIGGNFSLMMQANEDTDRIIEYGLAYTPFSKPQLQNYIQSLGSTLMRIYSFSYPQGKRLVQAVLRQSASPGDGFRQLLTEQIYPSLFL